MTPTLQDLANEFIQTHDLPGISVSIRHGNNHYYAQAGEFATNPKALVYSLTKTYTAAAILLLIRSKQLKLDSPVSNWLPEIPFMSEITIRQLLNHTSGLPDYGGLAKYHDAVQKTPGKPWNDSEFLQNSLKETLDFTPGHGWSYSNIGYLILRLLIQHTTQSSYHDSVASLLIAPLNLRHTQVVAHADDLTSLVAGHSRLLGTSAAGEDIRSIYHPGWVAPGVMSSTAIDVSSFYHQLLSGKILSAQALSSMCETVTVPFQHPLFATPSYGLGLMSFKDPQWSTAYGHSGQGPGYSAACYHFIDKELTIAVLCNCEAADKAESLILQLCESRKFFT